MVIDSKVHLQKIKEENIRERRFQYELMKLKRKLAYCEEENARLRLQNEALHDTAWELIRKIRTLEGQIKSEK